MARGRTKTRPGSTPHQRPVTRSTRRIKHLRASESARRGAVAQEYARTEKHGNNAYLQLCRENGCVYVPLVLETYGAWDPGCIPYLRGIARVHAVVRQRHPDSSLKFLMARLSCCLMSRIAADLLRLRKFSD